MCDFERATTEVSYSKGIESIVPPAHILRKLLIGTDLDTTYGRTIEMKQLCRLGAVSSFPPSPVSLFFVRVRGRPL